jgi:hypothetical protein
VTNLNDLSPEALKAAMEGGTKDWGSWASTEHHRLYVQKNTLRRMYMRKCRCGCGGRQTHGAYANGIILMSGCEMDARRWAKAANSKQTVRK